MLFHLWANLEAECLRSRAAISCWSRYGLDYGLWSDPATPDHFIWLTIKNQYLKYLRTPVK